MATNIDGSATSDKYGKYFRGNLISGNQYGLNMSIPPGTYYVSVLMVGELLQLGSGTTVADFLYPDDQILTSLSGVYRPFVTGSLDAPPKWVCAKIVCKASGNFEIRHNRIYDLCIVNAAGSPYPTVVR